MHQLNLWRVISIGGFSRMHIVIEMALLVTFSQHDWVNDSVATPPFNIPALIMHKSSLCFLLNSIPSLSPSFWVSCRVISLSAVSRLVQQNRSQLYSHGSKTGLLPIYCHPGMYLCPRAAVAKPVRCCLAQEHLLYLGPLLRLSSPFTCPSFSSYFCPGARASRGDFIDSSLSFSYKRSHFQVECYFYHLWMMWKALVPCYFLDHTISHPLRCGPRTLILA